MVKKEKKEKRASQRRLEFHDLGFVWGLGFGAWDLLLDHRVSLRLKFGTGFPLGKFLAVRGLVTDFQ